MLWMKQKSEACLKSGGDWDPEEDKCNTVLAKLDCETAPDDKDGKDEKRSRPYFRSTGSLQTAEGEDEEDETVREGIQAAQRDRILNAMSCTPDCSAICHGNDVQISVKMQLCSGGCRMLAKCRRPALVQSCSPQSE